MVERFLGGAWAAAHGPADPHSLLVWALDSGFVGLVPAPSTRVVRWAELSSALAELPARVPAVRVTGPLPTDPQPDRGFASHLDAEVVLAQQAVTGAGQVAAALGCDTVVFEPGAITLDLDDGDDIGDSTTKWPGDRATAVKALRNARFDAALDRVCRQLHGLGKALPDVRLGLRLSRSAAGIADPNGLAAILEDLPGLPLCYWHDGAVAARREELFGEPQGDALERFAARLAGISLSDCSEGSLTALPGSGSVDYPLLAAYGRRRTVSLPVAIELDPAVASSELPGIHAYLDKLHL